MLALLLTLLVLALANAFFVFGFNVMQQQKDRYEVGENLRIGINRLARELRQATAITSYDEVKGGRVSFKNLAGDTITYSIGKSTDDESAHQLIRSVRGAGNNPVARYIYQLQVEWTGDDGESGPGLATVVLTGAKGQSGDVTVRTAVRLKN